jgi:hypothetical protein
MASCVVTRAPFNSIDDFKSALMKENDLGHHVLSFTLGLYKKVESSCVAHCVADKCEYNVHLSREMSSGKFYIKSFNNTHSCSLLDEEKPSDVLNTTKIAENFTSLLSENVKEKRSDFVKTVLSKTHQVISPRQATVFY